MPYNREAFPPEIINKAVYTFGTPFYIYNEDIIRTQCKKLSNLFHKLPVKWLYAMKANDNPHILKIISDCGFGFDTVSVGEAMLGRLFNNPKNIFYTENNMSDMEMDKALDLGVIMNIGSLSRLQAVCESGLRDTVSIRIKPDIGDGHHTKVITGNKDSKFGIRIDIIKEAKSIADRNNVAITGIHCHIGSGIKKPENLFNAITLMLDVAKELPDVTDINFGGGIPVAYKNEDLEFNLQWFHDLVTPVLFQWLEKKPNTTFWFEPGRYITAEAGMLISKVTAVKDQGNKTYLGTDTGFNHLIRPVLYDALHEVVNISKWNHQAAKRYEISGNICESGDILAENYALPESEIGDILGFCDAGAYGMSMASTYNRRPLPSEFLITSEQDIRQIQKAVSEDDLVEELLKRCDF